MPNHAGTGGQLPGGTQGGGDTRTKEKCLPLKSSPFQPGNWDYTGPDKKPQITKNDGGEKENSSNGRPPLTGRKKKFTEGKPSPAKKKGGNDYLRAEKEGNTRRVFT